MAFGASFEEFRDAIWGSADGKNRRIKDLDIDHLVNILNWVKDRPTVYPSTLLPMLEQEAEYRKMLQFAEGKPMPTKMGDGHWALVYAED